jgi:hypothetical protein
MSDQSKSISETISALQERAKELACLYEIEDCLKDPDATLDTVLRGIVRAVPTAWERPAAWKVRIVLRQSTFQSPGFRESSCFYRADIITQDEPVGTIEICRVQQASRSKQGPLAQEKRRLVDAVARRVGQFVSFHRLFRLAELHCLLDKEGKALGDEGLTDESGRSASQESGYGGLCTTCVHSSTCTFPRRMGEPVLSCEEFDEHGKRAAKPRGAAAPSAQAPQTQMSEATPEPLQHTGLCATCENRETCTFPKLPGGVWHCEEFA